MKPCAGIKHSIRLFFRKSMGCTSGKIIDKKAAYSATILDESDVKVQTILKLSTNESKSKKLHRNSKSSNSCRNGSSGKHRKKKAEHKSNKTKTEQKSSQVNEKNASGKVTKNRSIKERPPKANFDSRITAKYHVKALIGKGTYSRVLRVEHRMTKQPYALKMIEAPTGREAFEAELSVLQRVNHPNVIKLIEVFESDNKVYMVMELATGGNLLDRLEMKGTFSEEDSRQVMQMVLSGVKYLHNVGITHRDLKPDNLLYYHPGCDSRIMITDFGLASTRKATGSPYMHTICGTPQYIAPEIVARRPYTCSVDMWAVGVIAYILLVGAFPFDADHDAQIFKLILKGKINMVESVWREFSLEAKSFVLELLQHDPTRRLTAAQALDHSWLTSPQLTYSPESSNGSRKSSSTDHYDHSQRSALSVGSSKSGRSISSLRSGHHRVQLHHLEALSSDPELTALM